MIAQVLPFVSTDETRYNISGVLVEGDGKMLRLVATDGHRMAIAERPSSIVANVIIARAALDPLRKHLRAIGDAPIVVVAGGKIEICGMPVPIGEAAYPDWRQVMPKNAHYVARVDARAFSGGLKATLAARKKNLDAHLEDRLLKCKYSTERQDVREEFRMKRYGLRLTLAPDRIRIDADGVVDSQLVDCDMRASMPLVIGFNGRYLLDALSAIKIRSVVCEFSDDLSPCLFADVEEPRDRSIAVVTMPYRM
jgi:DNA polymerase-3 subunit beta